MLSLRNFKDMCKCMFDCMTAFVCVSVCVNVCMCVCVCVRACVRTCECGYQRQPISANSLCNAGASISSGGPPCPTSRVSPKGGSSSCNPRALTSPTSAHKRDAKSGAHVTRSSCVCACVRVCACLCVRVCVRVCV